MAGKLSVQAGTVLHVWCAHCTPPKWKYHVVAYVEPLRYLLINTQAAAFQRSNAELLAHQVSLGKQDNSFLRHDSVLDCSQVVGGPSMSELEDAFLKNPSVLMGRISSNGRRAVRSVVSKSELLSSREIAAILAIW